MRLSDAHPMPRRFESTTVAPLISIALLLGGCSSKPLPPEAPQPARPASLAGSSCANLVNAFGFNGTVIAEAAMQPAGTSVGDDGSRPQPVPEHCLVKGRMHERTGAIDKRVYSIGFEMRLPKQWNGRFFYQANGGLDGVIVPALGNKLGGGPKSNALSEGFAVLSSDAGHPSSAGPYFGLDPQARIDYGYNAVGQLTPMAKALIREAYGRGPDRSYIAGCSNGGRHAMVAAARFADQYDGFLAGNPGLNMPKAALAQLFGVQEYARIAAEGANGLPDISTAFTAQELTLIGRRVLERCDALDGVSDGIVQASVACQKKFDLNTQIPTCTKNRNGTCLSEQQKNSFTNIMNGARTSRGAPIYARFWYDPGIAGPNWAHWEYKASQELDPSAVAFVFMTPPTTPDFFRAQGGANFARQFNLEDDGVRLSQTDRQYAESALSFMNPPEVTQLKKLRDRGGKVIVFHGTGDAVFSAADSADWYEQLNQNAATRAEDFARLFLVPQMAHCSGGASTDQFDLLTPLVKWVEDGIPPALVIARARGAGSTVVNPEVPAGWASDRSRPLCPYPKIATYKKSGDIDDAANFYCAAPAE